MTAPDLNSRPNSRPHAAARLDLRQDVAVLTAAAFGELSAADSVEYFELVDPDTLEAVAVVEGPVLAVTAVRVGRTRLIDNMLFQPHSQQTTPTTTPALKQMSGAQENR